MINKKQESNAKVRAFIFACIYARYNLESPLNDKTKDICMKKYFPAAERSIMSVAILYLCELYANIKYIEETKGR